MAHSFKSGVIVCACVILGTALPCLGQLQTTTPSPEHQKMGYFAGDWKLEGTMKISQNAPGGPFTSSERGEWVSGGFFLETHSSMHSVLGDVRGVRVLEYNPADKVYTYNAYNSLGEHLMATGHVVDDTWIVEFRCADEWGDCEGTLYREGGVSDGIYLQVRDTYNRRRLGYGHGRQGYTVPIRRDAAVVAVDLDRF